MNRPSRIVKSQHDLNPGEVLCDFCTAKCCKYFALPIDRPRTRQDYDYIRWYLLHDRASVFVEDGTWFLLVHTECKHLQQDNRCGIYSTRPQICREYSTHDCEFDDGYTYDSYFEMPEQVEEYMAALFDEPTGPQFRSPRPGLNIIH